MSEAACCCTWTCWVTLMLRPVASVSSAWGRGAPRTSSSPSRASSVRRVSSSLIMIVSCLGATDNWPSVKQQRHLYKHQPIARYSVAVIIRYRTFAPIYYLHSLKSPGREKPPMSNIGLEFTLRCIIGHGYIYIVSIDF